MRDINTISTGSCWVRVLTLGAALFWAGWYLRGFL
jgi:hypothetical protein